MNRVEKILANYDRNNITFNIITNGCIQVIINVKNGVKRIVSLTMEESDLFIQSI